MKRQLQEISEFTIVFLTPNDFTEGVKKKTKKKEKHERDIVEVETSGASGYN